MDEGVASIPHTIVLHQTTGVHLVDLQTHKTNGTFTVTAPLASHLSQVDMKLVACMSGKATIEQR
jgi:hypothetical protein